MRGYEPWPTTRRTVPLETARELVRRADEARAHAERSARQVAELRRDLESVARGRDEARARAEALERELGAARAELAAAREALDRPRPEQAPSIEQDPRIHALLADLANVRRQRDAQIERVREEERGKGLARLAEVADDLERAVALHDDPGSPWVQGIVALLGRVRHQLERGGGVLFGRFGDPFDPELHEAVGTAHGIPDTVVGVHRSGVRLRDGTLVRPAQVVVGTDREEALR